MISQGALVIGGAYRGLGAVRSLGRRGIPVWLLTEPDMVASASRYVQRSLLWPDGGQATQTSYLLELADSHDLTGWTLFPTDDESAALISRNHALLSRRYLLTSPPWETMKWLHDKRLLHRLGCELGLDQPRTITPSSREELEALDWDFPLILKPAIKETMNSFTHAKALRAGDRRELVSLYDEVKLQIDPELVMVQELIPGVGEDYAYAALCSRGHPLASLVAWRQRQYPVDFGRASTYVKTVDVPEVVEAARRLISAINLTGIAHIGFKRDPRDGQYKLLDVNVRTWGSHTLGRQVGMDFTYLLWRMVHGEPIEEMEAPPGLRWIRLSTDLPTAAHMLLRGQLSIADYLRSLRGRGPLEFATLSLSDPGPMLMDLPLLLRRLWKRRREVQLEAPYPSRTGKRQPASVR